MSGSIYLQERNRTSATGSLNSLLQNLSRGKSFTILRASYYVKHWLMATGPAFIPKNCPVFNCISSMTMHHCKYCLFLGKCFAVLTVDQWTYIQLWHWKVHSTCYSSLKRSLYVYVCVKRTRLQIALVVLVEGRLLLHLFVL